MNITKSNLLPKPTNKKLTPDQLSVLKILSRGNVHQMDLLLKRSPEQIERMIKHFYQRQLVVKDLKQHGFSVNDLQDLLYPEFDDSQILEALPILIKWLKKENLNPGVK